MIGHAMTGVRLGMVDYRRSSECESVTAMALVRGAVGPRPQQAEAER